MKARKIIFWSLVFVFIFSTNFASAANCAYNCFPTTCPAGTSGISGTCQANYVCCAGTPSNYGGSTPLSGYNPNAGGGTSGNNLTTSFNSPLGQNMGTVDRVIVSLQSYLNIVAGTIAIVFILIGASLYIAAAFGKVSLAELGKKMVIVAVGGFVVVVAAPIFWAEIRNIVQGNPETVVTNSGVSRIINGILPGFVTLIGLYAIISFLIGAITMLVASGDEKKWERGKTILKFAIMGTVISFGAVVITRQIIQLLSG